MFFIILFLLVTSPVWIIAFVWSQHDKKKADIARRAMEEADKRRREEYGRKFWEDDKLRRSATDRHYTNLPSSEYLDLP